MAIHLNMPDCHICPMNKIMKQEQQENEEIEEDTHVELAVLDSAGRIQVPRDYLDAIGVTDTNKLRVELEEGKIVLINPNGTKVSV